MTGRYVQYLVCICVSECVQKNDKYVQQMKAREGLPAVMMDVIRM